MACNARFYAVLMATPIYERFRCGSGIREAVRRGKKKALAPLNGLYLDKPRSSLFRLKVQIDLHIYGTFLALRSQSEDANM